MIRNKIIIVEDDPGISKYLQAALRGHDYEPMLATDGKTALEMIASHCPDLLLLDLGLPDMDGSEIIRSVRSWSRMPIIVISARSSPRVMPSLKISVSVLPQRSLTTGSIFSSASGERMLSGSCR